MLILEAFTRAGKAVGVLNDTSQQKLSERLNRTNTLTFQVEATMASWLATPPGETIICATDTEISSTLPRFVGSVVSRQASTGQTSGAVYQIGCADPSWILAKRRIGEQSTGFVSGSVSSPNDRDVILQAILAEPSLGIDGSASDYQASGISLGSIGVMMPTSVKYDPYTAASDAIDQLGRTLDGFDWRMRYARPTTSTGVAGSYPRMAWIDAAATLGIDKTSTVFVEALGGRNNCTSWSLAETADTQANEVVSVVSDWTIGLPIVVADATSENAYGRITDVITDQVSDDLRTRLAQQHLALRADPRLVASYQQTVGSTPSWGVDYDLGDIIHFRGWLEDSTLVVDSPLRVYGADTEYLDDGTRRVTPTLSPGG